MIKDNKNIDDDNFEEEIDELELDED